MQITGDLNDEYLIMSMISRHGETDNHKLPQKLTTTENSLRSNMKYSTKKMDF